MMLRAVIIDDEQPGINSLRILIQKFVPDVKVVAETTRGADAVELIENYQPEIVFLDINMPGMSGFEVLDRLSWKNFSLIFTTAHREYALKALKSNAVDYLLKPVDYQDIIIAVQKIRARLLVQDGEQNRFVYEKLLQELGQHSKLVVNSKVSIENIDLGEVLYLESKSNYTQIYLQGSKPALVSKTLKVFESSLCKDELGFMRVHHSFIINLHKVARYIKMTDTIVMVEGQKIPLAKSRKAPFFEWLNI